MTPTLERIVLYAVTGVLGAFLTSVGGWVFWVSRSVWDHKASLDAAHSKIRELEKHRSAT
jgi:hypothetical protein